MFVDVGTVTPQELERIGRRIYGKRHWRSKLALNLGFDTATVHRWGKREQIAYVVEVAVKGLLERHKVNTAAEKVVNERLRKEGKLRPRLRKKAPARRAVKEKKPRFDLAEQVQVLGADSLLPDGK